MNKIIAFALILCTASFTVRADEPTGIKKASKFRPSPGYEDLQEGDIIFQTSVSGLSSAIQLATRSKYSHCGLIFKEKGALYVLEAVQPVLATPLEKWIARGVQGKFVVKRLTNASKVLTPGTLTKMKQVAETLKGKDYDLTFEWDDDRIYCSELVWKIYKRGAGIEVGKLEKLKDFDLTNPLVKAKLKEHYGNDVPLNETIISPVAILNSPLLITVKSN
jgi:hypothetical protein